MGFSFICRAYRFVVATVHNIFMQEHLLARLSPMFNLDNTRVAKSVIIPPDGALCLLMHSNADDLFVHKIVWCKRDTGVKHEFLIVYIQEASNQGLRPRTAVILVERNAERAVVQDGSNANPGDSGRNTTPPADTSVRPVRTSSNAHHAPGRPQRQPMSFSLDSTSSDLLSSSSRSKDSGDVLVFSCSSNDKFVESRERPYKGCKTLEIDIGKFSLFKFVVLVNIVHDEHPDYDVDTYNCFWFARSLYKTVRLLVPDAAHTKRAHGLRLGKFKGIQTLQGRWTPEQFVENFGEVLPQREKEQEEKRKLANKPLKDAEERVEKANEEAKAERAKREREKERAEREKKRAEQEKERAEREKERAERAEKELRELQRLLNVQTSKST